MSLLAGIVARTDSPVPPAMRHALQRISRNPRDTPFIFEGTHYCCAKVDIGAFGTSGHVSDADGTFSLMAGEPLLTGGTGARDVDLRTIHERCLTGDASVLRAATGAFCIAQYQPTTRTLRLMTDKLGTRPLYYWIMPEFVAFATAVRILEALPEFPRMLDVGALTEMTAFGYPLADRMAYAKMHCIHAGHSIEITKGHLSPRVYWRWDDVPVRNESESCAAQNAHQEFVRAVERRLGRDRATASYLSGGLDSRAVVAALVERGTKVHTFNFARPGTQDQVLGAQIAAELGTTHHEVPKQPGERKPDYSDLMATAWSHTLNSLAGDSSAKPERPQVVWSGEGGSVALGHVHMHREMITRMRRGDIDAAIEEYLQREDIRVPLKMFTSKTRRQVASFVADGIREELAQLPHAEPGRRFHLFLLLNDQRRKLAGHFENIDLHRLEFELPFFDSDFLTSVIQVPIDDCLGHGFYHVWLEQFAPIITSVAWQSYPGHVPCAVPAPANLSYQWDPTYQQTEAAAQNAALIRRTVTLLTARDFPRPILSRPTLAAATALHAAGLRSYEYAMNAACLCHSYWRNCGGAWVIRPPTHASPPSALA